MWPRQWLSEWVSQWLSISVSSEHCRAVVHIYVTFLTKTKTKGATWVDFSWKVEWDALLMTLRPSDWQSESGLDSIRNSCDVFGKPTNILCRKDFFCTKVIFGLAITDPFRVLENHLFLGYLVVIEDDYQKKSWTKSRAQMKLWRIPHLS